jgi:hypothetical protein
MTLVPFSEATILAIVSKAVAAAAAHFDSGIMVGMWKTSARANALGVGFRACRQLGSSTMTK